MDKLIVAVPSCESQEPVSETIAVDLESSKNVWFDAISYAKQFNKTPVLYCILFKHGLMKIGSTYDIINRMSQLLCHGILVPVFDKILIESCDGHDLFNSEKIALKKISKIAKPYFNKEAFYAADLDIIKKVFIESIQESSYPKHSTFTPANYHGIAMKTNLYNCLSWLAEEKRLNESKRDAVVFVLSNMTKDGNLNENKWDKEISRLHPFALKFIQRFGVCNAILIDSGMSAKKRKMALMNYAMNTKVDFNLNVIDDLKASAAPSIENHDQLRMTA